jgi:biopolymer transport protein ExbD
MADIAFLLLIFFLVTTTIASDKGIAVLLPPDQENQDDVKIKERNIFNVLINSNDMLLVEEDVMDVTRLKAEAKRFVSNRGADPASSESPVKAVISLKTDRGTSYEKYIEVRDILKQAYSELRAEFLNVTLEEYNYIYENRKEAEYKEKYDRARAEYPEQVSDAEPSDTGGA